MSDILMPGGMSGLDLARTLRRQRPELPVLLVTGHSQSALQAVKEGFTRFENHTTAMCWPPHLEGAARNF